MASQRAEDLDSEPEDMLAEEDMLEEVTGGEGDEDVAMDSGGEDDDEPEEVQLQNDSIAYFDGHGDSVFAIAQHPRLPSIIATGGSEGSDDDAPGKGYVIDVSGVASRPRPLLPPSYNADAGAGSAAMQSAELQPLFSLDGHSDSINALAFTASGDYLLSGGLDGKLRAYAVSTVSKPPVFEFLAEAAEVPEVNWLAACPSAAHSNTIALGASDGSVWVYTVSADSASGVPPLQIEQSWFLHTRACTAGAWTSDGQLLATVAEDGSLYVWDVWGEAAARGLVGDNGVTVVALTEADQRFAVEGGLYSVAVEPRNAFLAAGGAGGIIRIVRLPQLSAPSSSSKQPQQRGGGRGKAAAAAAAASSSAATSQAGMLLASLHAQSDSIETLSFAPAPQTLLAAGSVDGSVVIYDTARSFSVRRSIAGAHEDFSVVRVEFVRGAAAGGWLLTSCGMDGVVRRWDLRGATAVQQHQQLQQRQQQQGQQQQQQHGAAAVPGLVKEWRGHRGDGEGGGVLGFVQGEDGERVVTAGDDGVVLVFEA